MGAQEDLIAQLLGQTSSGADVSDIGNFTKAIAANDYWGQAAAPIMGARFNTSTWSPGTTAGVAAAQGFLGSILKGIGQNQQAEQINKVASILPSLYADPMSVAAPEGVDEGAFGALKASAIARNSKGQSAQLAKLLEDVMSIKIAGQKSKAEAIGKVAGENEAYGVTGLENPNSPTYKIGQDKIGVERQLNNDFTNKAADFKYKEQGLKALSQAYLDTKGTSDYELIRRGAQMVEPGLAVRSDDVDSIKGAASVLGVSYNALQAAIKGETKLDPEVRAGIMRIAKRSYESSLSDYNTIRDNYLRRARDAKLNETSIVPYGAGKPFDELYPNLNIGGSSVVSAPVRYKEADLIAQGYTKGATGWIPPAGVPRG